MLILGLLALNTVIHLLIKQTDTKQKMIFYQVSAVSYLILLSLTMTVLEFLT